MPPTELLWEYRPHTEAKHTVLRGYLEARLAIMGQARGFPELVMVDGFAGPGRYIDGEKGSPLRMLDAFLEHTARASITARLRYFFIERDTRRYEYLKGQLESYKSRLHSRVTFEVFNDPFDTRMEEILRSFGPNPPPVFTFVDPFGIRDNHFEVSSRVLGFKGSEVLVYIPLYDIARHIATTEFEPHLENLFAGNSWRPALAIPDLQGRIAYLKDAFETVMARTCNRVMNLEIPSETANAGYFLFFGTSHSLGVEKMKDVFWKVDPLNGQRYQPIRKSMNDLLLPIVPEPNVAPLTLALFEWYGRHEFSIEEALDFTHLTRFKASHLRSHSLAKLEELGVVTVRRPPANQRPKTYAPGTMIRFLRQPRSGLGDSNPFEYQPAARAGA